MKLPNVGAAVVPRAKIVEYLLSPVHPTGRHKARFFGQFGFSLGAWQNLAAALRRHATEHELSIVEDTPFGTRYIVEGPLPAPDGRAPVVRSVWFIETG